jgi:5-carboxymethyl-2-hydroxymuconate isomerase
MPHVILEYSRNVIEELDFHPVFVRIHEALAATGAFAIEEIKSRAVCHDWHAVGSGRPQSAFVHVQLSILEGRSPEIRKAAGAAIMSIIRETFHQSWDELELSLSVEVREMARETYFKDRSDGPTHIEL